VGKGGINADPDQSHSGIIKLTRNLFVRDQLIVAERAEVKGVKSDQETTPREVGKRYELPLVVGKAEIRCLVAG
jgi:hypothetical protein